MPVLMLCSHGPLASQGQNSRLQEALPLQRPQACLGPHRRRQDMHRQRRVGSVSQVRSMLHVHDLGAWMHPQLAAAFELRSVTVVAADCITPGILHRRSCLAFDAGDASRKTRCKCSARRTLDRRLPLGHQPAAEEEAKTTSKEGGPPPSHRKRAKVG